MRSHAFDHVIEFFRVEHVIGTCDIYHQHGSCLANCGIAINPGGIRFRGSQCAADAVD